MLGGNDDPKARVRTLVGGERETTLLGRALDRPREHGIRVIEVVGEPGIGSRGTAAATRRGTALDTAAGATGRLTPGWGMLVQQTRGMYDSGQR